jgi:RimJ/RimL family protein N-acetyltransferase
MTSLNETWSLGHSSDSTLAQPTKHYRTSMGLTIRETTANDLPDLGRLWNDGRVMQWVGFPDGLGYDEEALRKWFNALRSNTHVHHFVIRDTDLGFCGELFYRLDPEHRRAELDIKLVPEAQGRGIATAGLSRLIELVFEREPSADTVWTEPTPENHASRALYARCGLTETNRPTDLRPGPSYWEKRRLPPTTSELPVSLG